MNRDPSAAELTPSTSVVTASSLWVGDDDIWQTVYVDAAYTDAHEVGLTIKYGDNSVVAYFDPVAAAELGEQLRSAARRAVAKASP